MSGPLETVRELFQSMRPIAFVIYSLPGALWLYAFTSFLALQWRGVAALRVYWPWILMPTVVAFASEGAQWFQLTDGSFDQNDLLGYLIAVCCFGAYSSCSTSVELAETHKDIKRKHRASLAWALIFTVIIGAADVVDASEGIRNLR